MSKKLEALIREWAEDVVLSSHKSGYYGINVVERHVRDPRTSEYKPGHRVLWWPKNNRIARMSSAVHCLDTVSQICLIVMYGRLLNDDGTVFDKYQLAKSSSLTVRRINELAKKAKKKLSEKQILKK